MKLTFRKSYNYQWPNVNLRLHDLLNEELGDGGVDVPILLNVGTCGLHTVHNAFKAVVKASVLAIYRFICQICFHWSTAKIGGWRMYLLFERHRTVCKYVNTVKVDKQYTEPSSKSYKIVWDAVGDVLVLGKMASFEAIAVQLHRFLVIFQCDNGLLPFVCTQLHIIITGLLNRFVESSILDDVQTVTQLLKIKYEDPANRKSLLPQSWGWYFVVTFWAKGCIAH